MILRKLAIGTLVAGFLAPLASACGDFEVHSVFTALDTNGDRRRTVFFTDTSVIYCDAEYASTRKEATFNAVIRQIVDANGGPVDIVVSIGELAPGVARGVLSLPFPRPTDPTGMTTGSLPYAKGKYRCEYYVDGVDPKTGISGKQKIIQGTTDFTVEYINCPVAGAIPGSKCAGFVAPGSAGNGCLNALNMKQACNCDMTGSWVCP